MTKTHRRQSSDAFLDTPVDASSRESLHHVRERIMDDLAIRQDGASFIYNGYRYGSLRDAVEYARLIRSRERSGGEVEMPTGPFSSIHAPQGPSDEERTLMRSLAIYYEQGQYRFENYRYDRLADAATYARLALRRAPPKSASSNLAGILFRPLRTDR